MAVAVFNYTLWATLYPQLATSVAEPQAEAYFFQAATLYLDNTDDSIVENVDTRLSLLNLLVAHLAALGGATAAGAAGLVGRISQATEGSVTIRADMPMATSGTEAWYMQTPWGAQYWAAIAQFRSGFYVPGPVEPAWPSPWGWGQGRWLP